MVIKTTVQLQEHIDSTRRQMVERRIPADIETPVSAFYKLRPVGAVFLLESVEHGAHFGRYSFIGISPGTRIAVGDKRTTIFARAGEQGEEAASAIDGSPDEVLSSLFPRGRSNQTNGQPPLLGGAVGYVGYDIVGNLERVFQRARDDGGDPIAELYLVDNLVVFDHVKHEISVLTLTDGDDAGSKGEALAETVTRALRSPLQLPTAIAPPPSDHHPSFNMSQGDYCRAVLQAKEHIAAGDIYQLVLSQRLDGQTSAEPFSVYRALRMLNPSPYLFYLDFGERQVIGSSPEALVTLTGDRAVVRPIAGTRPRGRSLTEDRSLAEDLLADEKERAEHVMLVDLGRNDLGRCCSFGSVSVDEYMEVERFSHVMHLCSTVSGSLRPELSPFELFRSVFPAGTVSGAPKIRAMQLIDSLESAHRGLYSGAVGYVSPSGDMDWCIAIRTIMMKGSAYSIQAGAGIVADSEPEKEYQETLHKLAALRAAIELAEEKLQ